jgi:site-specific DNA recombinase
MMATAPDGTVTLYLRKSTKDAGRSADRQRAELREAAEREGFSIAPREYIDPDFSASRYARRARPDYDALLASIQAGDVQVLGLYEASRGARDLTVWSQLLDLCRAKRVPVWVSTHDKVYDLSRRRDWRALADEGVNAADEAEMISERTQSGKRSAARQGTPAGRLVYGFSRTYDAGGRLIAQIAHPEQAPIVREIVARVAAGEDSLAEIARDLNRRGVPPPYVARRAERGPTATSSTLITSGRWLPSVVRQIALNPSYVALRVHRGEIVGPAAWEPLLDQDLWRTAVAVLTTPGRAVNTSTALSHWLSGAVLCGACRHGQLWAGSRSGGCGSVYRCRHCHRVTVTARGLETTVEAAILARLAKPDALEAFRPATGHAELAKAGDAVRVLRDRLKAHYAEAAAGRLSATGLSAVEGHLLPEIERAEHHARQLRVPPELGNLAGLDIPSRWGVLPASRRRAIVRAVAELVCAPTSRRGRLFDPGRLGQSRWVGDTRTWADLAGP